MTWHAAVPTPFGPGGVEAESYSFEMPSVSMTVQIQYSLLVIRPRWSGKAEPTAKSWCGCLYLGQAGWRMMILSEASAAAAIRKSYSVS